jgi:DNA-binding response OmpR family regulator
MSDRTAWLAEEKLHLSPTEYSLTLLMRNAGTVLTYTEIGKMVWGEDTSPQAIRVYVRFLRQKLHDSAKHPQYILTKSGIGYQFDQEVEELYSEKQGSESPLKLGNMELVTEHDSCKLLIGGCPHSVGSTELSILKILLQHKGHVVSKTVIADSIAHGCSRVHHNSIEVYIHRLRRILKGRGAKVAIDTVRGAGYLISARSERA